MVRIWLNHWFSSIYRLIERMKQEHDDYYVIGTNEREYAVYRLLCDEWYQEPVLSEEDYAAYCLKFCQEHQVQVFVPRRKMLAISRHKAEFEAIGVKVLVDEADLIDRLNYKTKAYEWLSRVESLHIPPYERVTTVREFVAAYENLTQTYRQVCFKFEHDEGGLSFRLIDNERRGYAALFKPQTARITLDSAVAALSEVDTFSPILVMPYLSGAEVSVDCLHTPAGLIMVPRIKAVSRTERIVYQEDILQMCRDLWEVCPLECPFNVQFKYLGNTPYFLEVNTRLSGGAHMVCEAEGINLLEIAVMQLLGQTKDWHLNPTPKLVSYVETPVVLEGFALQTSHQGLCP